MDPARYDLEAAVEQLADDRDRVDKLIERSISVFDTDLQRSLNLCILADAVASRIDYPLGAAHALTRQVHVHHARGEYAEALARAQEGIDRYAQLGESKFRAILTQKLGLLYAEMGDFARALESLLQARALAEACGDAATIAKVIFYTGMVHSDSGNPQLAIEYYQRCIPLFEAMGNLDLKASVLNSLCVDSVQVKDFDAAQQAGEEAMALFVAAGDLYGAGVAQSSMGEVALARGDFSTAVVTFEAALGRLKMRDTDFSSRESLETRLNLGRSWLGLGRLDAAAQEARTVLEGAEAGAMHPLIMECSRVLTDICERAGDLTAALNHLRRYTTVRDQILNETNQRQLRHLKIILETREAVEEAEWQRQLREQDRQHFERIVKLKDDVLHHATHDIKNPLSTVSMALFLLEKEISPDNKLAYATLQRAKESAVKIRDLIASVLDLAKLEAASVLYRDPIDLESSLTALMLGHELHASGRNIELSLSVPPGLICLCNQARLEQVLNNLVSNAVKYSGEGGHVRLSATRADDAVMIVVQDDGYGIPAESLPHLFKRFYRVPESAHLAQGTGIGLSIVKLLVEQHGGTIAVDSAVGQGTTFTITLPQPAADAELSPDSIPL
ncbi:MAG: tetratricopeptide repeat protein [Chloroflexi bacterium]|nr:tetratricopeptide repeat protein [Chloroflexota bacterium]